MENVFWYDYYNDNNIHEYCNGDLRDCKITKKTQCKINHEKNIECINSFFEYVYKLINNTEKNDYFSEKFN